MQAKNLYEVLESEFPRLVVGEREKGQAYFLDVVRRHKPSTRVIRISEKSDGSVSGMKLSVTARRGLGRGKIGRAASVEDIKNSVRLEISLLESELKGAGISQQ